MTIRRFAETRGRDNRPLLWRLDPGEAGEPTLADRATERAPAVFTPCTVKSANGDMLWRLLNQRGATVWETTEFSLASVFPEVQRALIRDREYPLLRLSETVPGSDVRRGTRARIDPDMRSAFPGRRHDARQPDDCGGFQVVSKAGASD